MGLTDFPHEINSFPLLYITLNRNYIKGFLANNIPKVGRYFLSRIVSISEYSSSEMTPFCSMDFATERDIRWSCSALNCSLLTSITAFETAPNIAFVGSVFPFGIAISSERLSIACTGEGIDRPLFYFLGCSCHHFTLHPSQQNMRGFIPAVCCRGFPHSLHPGTCVSADAAISPASPFLLQKLLTVSFEIPTLFATAVYPQPFYRRRMICFFCSSVMESTSSLYGDLEGFLMGCFPKKFQIAVHDIL